MQYKDIFIYRNVPYVQRVTIFAPTGLPQNVTGYTGKMYLAKHHESETKYAVDIVVENAANGIMRISMSAASTAQLPIGHMIYSVFITPLNQDETLLTQGTVIVEPTVHI